MTNPKSLFSIERAAFHRAVASKLLVLDEFTIKKGTLKNTKVPAASNADAENTASRKIANAIANSIGARKGKKLAAQSSGDEFERAVCDFLRATFLPLRHLRPGSWDIRAISSRNSVELGEFEQYGHLKAIASIAKSNPEVAIALGSDYLIAPDVIVTRGRESDASINSPQFLVGADVAKSASLRSSSGAGTLLHASISCKWTIRSDRAQNSRSEALNLLRNRKGRTPHIAVVTGEPLPSRLSSLALGTGDIDCVYHFALYELLEAVQGIGQSEAAELLKIMIDGKRLRDISDLPLDLAV